ncbi:MAG: hypothetical protein NTU62_12770 [Spirochaetes bacterium]|nr:hypothetical protein [Spirochaetota bacterium]
MNPGSVDCQTIPDPPPSVGAGPVLGRLVDGIGFRLRRKALRQG